MRYPKIVSSLKKELEDRKAEEVEIIDVRERTPFTDYYLLATAPNEKALGGFADDVIEVCDKQKVEVRKQEGTPESGWILVDAGSVVVHLFTANKRAEIGFDQLLAKK
jgi:ribosome-associated protein